MLQKTTPGRPGQTQIILHKIIGDMEGSRQIFDSRRNRFNGGNSDNGGLANVNANDASNRWNNRSFRFLEVL